MAQYTATRPVAVALDGPYAEQSRYSGDEYPEWAVCLADSDGEPVGKIYRCRSYDAARRLAANMARDRRLPLEDESSPA